MELCYDLFQRGISPQRVVTLDKNTGQIYFHDKSIYEIPQFLERTHGCTENPYEMGAQSGGFGSEPPQRMDSSSGR